MTFLEKLNPFRKPTADEWIANTLATHKRELVLRENSALYQNKMAEYYRESIESLDKQVPTAS
jgi:hypothetical protein